MINCPLRNSKDYKQLKEFVGKEMADGLWRKYNGYIPESYFKPLNTESTQDVNIEEKEPIGFRYFTLDKNEYVENQDKEVVDPSDLMEKRHIKPDFRKLVNEDAVALFSNEDIVKEEVEESQELEEERTPGIFDGSLPNIVTVDEVLNNILGTQSSNTSKEMAELISSAKRLVNKSGATITFVEEDELTHTDTVMEYDPKTNTIRISKERLKSYSTEDVIVAFLHEIAHGQTVVALLKKPENRTFDEQELVDLVDEFMKKYSNSSLAKEYGFTNRLEFVAEFYANPEFRRQVKEQESGWFKRLIDAIRRLFNAKYTTKYQKLYDTIISFVNQDQTEFNGIENYKGTFLEQRLEEESKHDTTEKQLDNLLSKMQDRLDSVAKKYKGKSKYEDKSSNTTRQERLNDLIDKMKEYRDTHKWATVLAYIKNFNSVLYSVKKTVQDMIDNDEIQGEEALDKIFFFDEYLSMYDLLPYIHDVVSGLSIKTDNLTKQEEEAFYNIKQTLRQVDSDVEDVTKKMLKIKKAQTVSYIADDKFNTEVETKHRVHLTNEYNTLKAAGNLGQHSELSVNEYVSLMMDTRDKDDFEADLLASAQKRVNDPSVDMSYFHAFTSDRLNMNSRIIQIVNNIIASFRTKMLATFKKRDMIFEKHYRKFLEANKGKDIKQLYENMVEQASDGRWYLKGAYSIKFKDSYENEFVPLRDARDEFFREKRARGFSDRTIRNSTQYKALNSKLRTWYDEHTKLVKRGKDKVEVWPADRYLNEKRSASETEILKYFMAVNNANTKIYEHGDGLTKNRMNAEFHLLPSVSKTDLERVLGKDGKGILKDKFTDLTTIKADDLGIESKEEAIDSKNQLVMQLKPLFRGDLGKEQSLDLGTLFRKEIYNATEYETRMQLKPRLSMILDVIGGKVHHKKATTGLGRVVSRWSKRSPEQEVQGQFSNEYMALKGIIERTVFNVFSKFGGTFLGKDVNKIVAGLNGYTAGLGMMLNYASANVNIANGFTLMMVERFGNHRIVESNLLKAEIKYGKAVADGSLLKDTIEFNKKSYFNQLLEQFDVFGNMTMVEQDALKDTLMKKFASRDTFNILTQGGEHMMHSILTEAILSGIKVMNKDHRYIDKEGNVVSKEEAASVTDMLIFDSQGILTVDPKAVYTDFTLKSPMTKGGKSQLGLLIKKKVFDMFGVYDNNFKSELSKTFYGKFLLMFKNFFLSGAEYRYKGIQHSLVHSSKLTDDERMYSTAEKEYIEGIYTTLIRFIKSVVRPELEGFKLALIKENYNKLSEYEKANLKKAIMEIALTTTILPMVGALMTIVTKTGADDDNFKESMLWYFLYVNRRLIQELALYRNPIEAAKLLENPVAASRLVNNLLKFSHNVMTPINFYPEKKGDYIFSWADEDSEGRNELLRSGGKVVPVFNQLFTKDSFKELYNYQFEQ